MARQGKIARLPHALRDRVNRALLNGETARELLGWLNQEAEAIETWEQHFEGAEANPQNLSEWRLGGYKDWIRKREKVENLKTLSSFCLDAAKAGQNISDGAAAIAAGELLQALEEAAHDEDADLGKLTSAISGIRAGNIAQARLDLDRAKHETKREEVALSRDKFERQTVEQFLKFAKTKEAQAILDSGKSKSVQMSEMRKLMFGERPGRKKK
jgi:hypothetical protein